jgi:protein phosphatase inhibitor 2
MEDPIVVKPALKKKPSEKKKDLKWDEAKILEHDQLRGTRMKIEEPNTPYHHNYDSGSETDGSHKSHEKNEKESISWDHLQNKLDAAAAAAQVYPNSPAGSRSSADDEDRDKELKALEFKEHRKRHYNEMEVVRKFRQENQDEQDDVDNDADNEGD